MVVVLRRKARITGLVVLTMAGMTAFAWSGGATEQTGGTPTSRCPTPNQQRLQAENAEPGAYTPGAKVDQPVTLTPTLGSETLRYPFGFSRSEETRVLTFSVSSPMPIAAEDLAVAFQGDLRRTDEKEVFPLNQSAQQAAIVPVIRSDGRLVSIHVCVDPGQPDVAAPGRYQGRLAWNAKSSTEQGTPLVSPGEAPAEITLQYERYGIAWMAFLLAFVAGMAVKTMNDVQRNLANSDLTPNPDQAPQQADASRRQGRFHRWVALTGLTARGFVVSTLFALGIGFVTFYRGYYGNPEFVGDFTGDLATLFAAIFAAVVAAHAGAGALSGGLSRSR